MAGMGGKLPLNYGAPTVTFTPEAFMSEPWFHRRIPQRGEGEGYGVRSREGWVVALVAVLLCALSIVIPVQVGLGAWQVYFIAAAGVIITIGALLRVIMTHSD